MQLCSNPLTPTLTRTLPRQASTQSITSISVKIDKRSGRATSAARDVEKVNVKAPHRALPSPVHLPSVHS